MALVVKLEGVGQVTDTGRAVSEQVCRMLEPPAAQLTAAVHTHTSTLVHQGPDTPCWSTNWCTGASLGEHQSWCSVWWRRSSWCWCEAIVYFCFAGGTEAASHPQTPPSRNFRSSSISNFAFPSLNLSKSIVGIAQAQMVKSVLWR